MFIVGGVFHGGEHGRVVSQRLMIVDVFVAEGDKEAALLRPATGEDALGDEIALLMNGVKRIAGIVNEGVDAFGETEFLIDLPKQNRPGVGGEPAPVEPDGDFLDFAQPDCLGGEFHGTLCLDRLWLKSGANRYITMF